MALLGTYYLNGPSLGAATSVYIDATLTTVAPDGWYREGATVRQLVGGVFTDVISSCAACSSPCSVVPANYIGDAAIINLSKGTKSTVIDVGAIIVEIQHFATEDYPSGVTVEYNGVIYNTLSCQNFGLVQGPANEPVYIGDVAKDCGIVAAGLQSLPVYNFNSVTNVFDNTGQFLTSQVLAPQVQLSPGVPGKFVMVIPKTAPTPTDLIFQGILLCGSTLVIPNYLDITVKCPTILPSFTSTVNRPLQIDTCGIGTDHIYYSADVNGSTATGGPLGLYDWVFSDGYGQTVLPDGWYRSPSVPSPDTSFEVQNGIIIGFGACAAVTGWNVDYEVENAIIGGCSANVTSLTLTASQPPTTLPFPPAAAPSTGTWSIPAGITLFKLELDWNNLSIIPPCGAIKLVIEKDGVIIATKTITPTTALVDSVEVSFNLDADAVVYGYVTLA